MFLRAFWYWETGFRGDWVLDISFGMYKGMLGMSELKIIEFCGLFGSLDRGREGFVGVSRKGAGILGLFVTWLNLFCPLSW